MVYAWVCRRGNGGIQAYSLEQHVLIEGGESSRARLAAQRLGDAAGCLGLGVVLGAVGEGGVEGDGEDGFLLFGVHCGFFHLIWNSISSDSPSRSCSMLQTARTGTEILSPAIWISKRSPCSSASARRRNFAMKRSEARRVGKECVSTCRFRWSTDH